MIHLVYPQIADHLTAKVPALDLIDLDQEQFDFEDPDISVPDRVALINIDVPQWHDRGLGLQRGDAIVTVRVGLAITEDTYSGSDQRAAAMAKLLFIDELHKVLNHYSGNGFGKLVRVSSRKEPSGEYKRRWIYTLSYKCEVTDVSAVEVPANTVTAELVTKPGTRPATVPDSGYVIPL